MISNGGNILIIDCHSYNHVTFPFLLNKIGHFYPSVYNIKNIKIWNFRTNQFAEFETTLRLRNKSIRMNSLGDIFHTLVRFTNVQFSHSDYVYIDFRDSQDLKYHINSINSFLNKQLIKCNRVIIIRQGHLIALNHSISWYNELNVCILFQFLKSHLNKKFN